MGLEIDPFSQGKIDGAVDELQVEHVAVTGVGRAPKVNFDRGGRRVEHVDPLSRALRAAWSGSTPP